MPDDLSVLARTEVPPSLPSRSPKPNWRFIVPVGILAGILGAIVVTVIIRLPNGHRPECPHDPGHPTIAGDYTPVPEYHDCQRLVLNSDNALIYGKPAALFLAQAVIEGSIQATPLTFDGTTVQAQTPQRLPRGFDFGGVSLTTATSRRFVPAGRFALPGSITAAPSDTTTFTATGVMVIPWVQVVADEAYPPLGIEKGFNCMYFVTYTGSNSAPILLGAKMVYTNSTTYKDCSLPTFMALAGTPLNVMPNGVGETPRVTRWDWSDSDKAHVIGVPCPTPAENSATDGRLAGGTTGGSPTGAVSLQQEWVPNNWCDVGAYTSKGSVPHGTDSPQRAIKGWSDEQYLADPQASGPVRTDVIGTVFPVAGLDKRTKAVDYDTGFAIVAYVALRAVPGSTSAPSSLEKYTERFGFHAVDPDQPFTSMSKISLCSGPKETCFRDGATAPACTPQSFDPDGKPIAEQWWARTEGSDPAKTKYFCVTYRKHPTGFKMPGVVRWRWHPNPGETNWFGCPEGCCENEG